jgi:hypothetical protein
VQGQDLIFPSGENTAVVVTVAADAARWDEEQAAIDLIYNSLDVTVLETDLRDEFAGEALEEGVEQ